MALTIERVALLRRVELFAGTADRVLAGIARVLEEVTCPAGTVIVEAGAVEDWLFVVEHGEVEVIRPDRRVRMGAGSVVGELADLDAQPEIARHKSSLGLHVSGVDEQGPRDAVVVAVDRTKSLKLFRSPLSGLHHRKSQAYCTGV